MLPGTTVYAGNESVRATIQDVSGCLKSCAPNGLYVCIKYADNARAREKEMAVSRRRVRIRKGTCPHNEWDVRFFWWAMVGDVMPWQRIEGANGIEEIKIQLPFSQTARCRLQMLTAENHEVQQRLWRHQMNTRENSQQQPPRPKTTKHTHEVEPL